ncbi:MAG: nucleotide exchange factor GrpE [Candidatus Hydrothermarchaeota archaeon]
MDVENEIKEGKTEENKFIEQLKDEILQKEKSLQEYKDRLVRLMADFENYKKRASQEKEEIIKHASENLIVKLLTVLDSFELALEAIKNNEDKDSVYKGIEMIYNQFRDILEKEGLKEIEALNKPFDPYLHESVMIEETNEYPNNMVIEEFQKGYMLGTKVIRYSKVKVAKNKEDREE